MFLVKKYYNKIIITTGGTGGHIIPSISIYRELIKSKIDVYWITDKLGLKFLIKEKIKKKKIYIINIKSFKKLNFIKKIFYIIKYLKLIFKISKIIKNINPSMIIGMGSYISFPSCFLSWILNIPLIIHEQNFILGLSNKILSFISTKIFFGFKNKKYLIKNKFIYTGNPIRKSILKIKKNIINNKLKKNINILILGGSQGSDFINNLIINILKKINTNNINIWHQVGFNNYLRIYNIYIENNIIKYLYKIEEFIKDISISYKWADLLISRSGALIVSESLYIGLPSIFIPYLHNDKHQYFNALCSKKLGLAKIIPQSNYSEKKVFNLLKNLNIEKLNKIYTNFKKNKNKIINNSLEIIINNIKNIIIK